MTVNLHANSRPIDLSTITQHTTNRPEGFTPFSSAAEFDALPDTFKDQILFLDEEASKFLWEFSKAAHIVTGGPWDPFEKGNFKEVSVFKDFVYDGDHEARLKKWLFHRGVPFSSWVYLLGHDDVVIMLTWKMLIKFCSRLFLMDDVMVFDNSLNWCLFLFHEDKLFFGRGNQYDNIEDLRQVEDWN